MAKPFISEEMQAVLVELLKTEETVFSVEALPDGRIETTHEAVEDFDTPEQWALHLQQYMAERGIRVFFSGIGYPVTSVPFVDLEDMPFLFFQVHIGHAEQI